MVKIMGPECFTTRKLHSAAIWDSEHRIELRVVVALSQTLIEGYELRQSLVATVLRV